MPTTRTTTEKIERIGLLLQTLIAKHQDKLSQLQSQQPGYFATPRVRGEWVAELEKVQDRIVTLHLRFSQMQELKSSLASASA